MAPSLASLVSAVLVVGGAIAVKFYATKYDHVDVEAILNNRRMVKYYAACLLSRGPCPPEGIEFKRILPEALQTNCERCTEKQKTVTMRTIRRLMKEYPKIWSELAAQWDPDDIYVSKFESTYGKVTKPTVVANRFGETEDDVAQNTITQIFPTTYSLPPSSTTIKPPSTTTAGTATTTTSTTTPRPTQSFTNPASSSTTKTPRPPVRPRPNIGDRIGANIEATVKIVKAVEQMVSGYAREKMGFINKLFKFGR